MNSSKALRAAHILKKFCIESKCKTCIFSENENRALCSLFATPRYYSLQKVDQKIYKKNEQDGTS